VDFVHGVSLCQSTPLGIPTTLCDFHRTHDPDRDRSLLDQQPMSIENHPNIHAVKFMCELLDIILKGQVPTLNQMQIAFLTSLRGNGKELTPEEAKKRIGFDQLAELMRSKLQREVIDLNVEVTPELMCGFVCEVSSRLDRALGSSAQGNSTAN
jgi:hypothetical protein